MKEVFSAVIPYLKKINWRLDAEAFLSKTGWFIVEENGTTAELVFRKNGSLLLIQNGELQDGSWEVVPEIQALLINVNGNKRLYDASWGTRPMLLMEEHGKDGRCMLFDREWIREAQRIPALMHCLTADPSVTLDNLKYYNFELGEVIPLVDGAELRTLLNTYFDSKLPNGKHNMVLKNWAPAPDGLHWSADNSKVFEVKDGKLWLSYRLHASTSNRKFKEIRLFSELKKKKKSARGNVVAAISGSHLVPVPDGIYHFGWWTRVQVKNGRVI